MFTKPPCYLEDEKRDCPRRYVGCRAWCDDWHEWLAIHEKEKEQQDANKQKHRDIIGFISQQGARTRVDNQRKYAERTRTKRRG